MTYVPNWPTREEWETRERQTAEWMIETGCSHDEDSRPGFSDEERDELFELLPAVVKQIRRMCGQVERATRAQYPLVAELFSRKLPPPSSMNDIDAWFAPVDALEGDDKDAFELLVTIRDVRREVSHMDKRPSPSMFKHWPAGVERPSSPEIDRVVELCAQAEQRHRERNRESGRRMLAAVNAPDAWDEELERRAHLDAYFRNGPLIRR